jgi:integrase
MAQNRIPRGEHGDIVVRQTEEGLWRARVQVRDLDGRIRSVRASGETKGAARRLLERRLDARVGTRATGGATSDMSFETLATVWLQHRKDHGKARSDGPLAPQTLAAYDAVIRTMIIPAIGKVQVREADVLFLDRLFADIENGRRHGSYPEHSRGHSTKQLRAVLSGMLGLAVAHGALSSNPIREAARTSRRRDRVVRYLSVEQANHLRSRVRRENLRIPDRRMPNQDLEDFVDLLLGTGCREGEALAIRPRDLIDFDTPTPKLHVCGTLLEPRKGFIDQLSRQDTTKNHEDRILILPDAVVQTLQARLDRMASAGPDQPIFASRTGNWLSPANLRTRLREALRRAADCATPLDHTLEGCTFHTLRRTVGTLIAHDVSLDAAREQLGHRDPSITYQHYVGKRPTAPDVRATLDLLLQPLPAEPDRNDSGGS